MTVKELKQKLEDYPDDTPVFVEEAVWYEEFANTDAKDIIKCNTYAEGYCYDDIEGIRLVGKKEFNDIQEEKNKK